MIDKLSITFYAFAGLTISLLGSFYYDHYLNILRIWILCWEFNIYRFFNILIYILRDRSYLQMFLHQKLPSGVEAFFFKFNYLLNIEKIWNITRVSQIFLKFHNSY